MYNNKSVVLNNNYLWELLVKTQIRNVTVTKNISDTSDNKCRRKNRYSELLHSMAIE